MEMKMARLQYLTVKWNHFAIDSTLLAMSLKDVFYF